MSRTIEMILKDFRDHKASYHVFNKICEENKKPIRIEFLEWKKEKSNLYAITYMLNNGFLHVSGDLGSATYRFYDDCDLEWISKCDISYFYSKCEASETGKNFTFWNADEAIKKLESYASQDFFSIEEFKEANGDSELYNEQEWMIWLSSHGYEVFGENYVEMGNIGETIHHRCFYHLYGLKEAFKNINGQRE